MENMLFSNSGAEFEVHGDLIIKKSKDIAASGFMQAGFNGNFVDLNLKTPQLFLIGQNVLKMQYIRDAMPLPVYFTTIAQIEIQNIILRLFTFVCSNFKNNQVVEFSGTILSNKINSIKQRLSAYKDISICDYVKDAIEPYNWALKTGHYHGDLTFSNIIAKDHNYYLIDFLPGYINSPILDIVKFKQEYKLNWSNLIEPMQCETMHYKYACELLKEMVEHQFKSTEIFEAINYLRILPYVTEDKKIILRREIKNLV